MASGQPAGCTRRLKPTMASDNMQATSSSQLNGTPQAVQAGKQPKVHLARTHERTLDHVPLEVLLENGVDEDAARATLESVDEQRQALEGLFSRVANPEE